MARAPPPAPSTMAPGGHLSSGAPIRARSPARTPSTSVLWPRSWSSSRTTTLTAPAVRASSDRASTREATFSLCGASISAPANSSCRSCAMTSGRRCVRFSQRSMTSGNPAAAMAACCTASKAVWVEDWPMTGRRCTGGSSWSMAGVGGAVGRGVRRRSRGPMLSSAAAWERSHSGLVRRFAKPLKGVSSSEGSNPSLSASALGVVPVAQWIERQVADLKVVRFESRRARHPHLYSRPC